MHKLFSDQIGKMVSVAFAACCLLFCSFSKNVGIGLACFKLLLKHFFHSVLHIVPSFLVLFGIAYPFPRFAYICASQR